MAVSTIFPLMFGLGFIGVPLVSAFFLLGFEDVLNRLVNDFTWVFYIVIGFIGLTILLVVKKIRSNGDQDLKLSFFKSDKSYIKKTFSSSGTHSFGSSSGSGRSSSSSFSGGGGSSGGGGASGSW